MAGALTQGHVFISYAREDAAEVDRIQQALEDAGIPVWRDTTSLWPGEDWRAKIADAITAGALAVIACFSGNSERKSTAFQREEILVAIQLLRQRDPDLPWLIPVRLSDCKLPRYDLGAGRTLDSLHRVDLFGAERDAQASRLVAGVQRLLAGGDEGDEQDAPEDNMARVLTLIGQGYDVYRYLVNAGTVDEGAVPETYFSLRRLYPDLDVLLGPDGPFPIAVLDLAPEARDDLEKLLGAVVPSPTTTPVHDRRVIEAIKSRGSGIWDGTTFSLSTLTLTEDGCAQRLDAYLGSYFAMVCSAGLLEYELLDALKNGGDQAVTPDELPLRMSALAAHPTTLASLCAGGGVDATIAISTLVVYRRAGTWWLLCDVRSKKVAEYGDLFHVVPSFIFQPVVAPTPANVRFEWNVRHNIFREYLEELFAVPEAQHSGNSLAPDYFYEHENLEFLQGLLDDGGASLHGVALIFNLLNHRPEICTLLLIEDERWYEHQKSGVKHGLRRIQFNDEFIDHEGRSAGPHQDVVMSRELDDPVWSSVARPWTMVPPGAPALVLGTRQACRQLGLPEPGWLRPFRVDPGDRGR